MSNERGRNLKTRVKRHIPKDWLSELRITYRIVMEAINDIKTIGSNLLTLKS